MVSVNFNMYMYMRSKLTDSLQMGVFKLFDESNALNLPNI